MVRALLDGRKTQTRRVVKGVPSWDHYGRDIMDWGLSGIHQGDFGEFAGSDRWFLDVQTDVDDNSRREIRCPYGAPGDTLWVRESGLESTRTKTFRMFRHDASDAAGGHYWVDCDGGRYGAGYGPAITRASQLAAGGWKVRPPIHMPRWASRLTLRITDVRVERLNDISEEDALAEGTQHPSLVPILGAFWSSRDGYAKLWEHINGPGSWAANPFVWAVSFEIAEPPMGGTDDAET